MVEYYNAEMVEVEYIIPLTGTTGVLKKPVALVGVQIAANFQAWSLKVEKNISILSTGIFGKGSSARSRNKIIPSTALSGMIMTNPNAKHWHASLSVNYELYIKYCLRYV